MEGVLKELRGLLNELRGLLNELKGLLNELRGLKDCRGVCSWKVVGLSRSPCFTR